MYRRLLSSGGPAIEEGLDDTPTLDENVSSVGLIDNAASAAAVAAVAPLQQQETQMLPLEAEPTEPAKFSWATLASRNTGEFFLILPNIDF